MERTIIVDMPDEVKEFMALPSGVYKNIAYNSLTQRKFRLVSYMTSDGNHYFSSSNGCLNKFGQNYVIKEREIRVD